MKLYKYRCSTCGKIWYEEEYPKFGNLTLTSIHHGCPDGCDDTGEYLGYVEIYVSNIDNLRIGEGCSLSSL